MLEFLKLSVGVTKYLLGCPETFVLDTPVVEQVSWFYREQRKTKVPPGFAQGSAPMEGCNGKAERARTGYTNQDCGGAQLSLCILYVNYLATKRQEGKGMLLPGNMPCVCLMHIFELLKRRKQNSLVAEENL